MRMKGTIMETIVQAKRVLEIFKEMEPSLVSPAMKRHQRLHRELYQTFRA